MEFDARLWGCYKNRATLLRSGKQRAEQVLSNQFGGPEPVDTHLRGVAQVKKQSQVAQRTDSLGV